MVKPHNTDLLKRARKARCGELGQLHQGFDRNKRLPKPERSAGDQQCREDAQDAHHRTQKLRPDSRVVSRERARAAAIVGSVCVCDSTAGWPGLSPAAMQKLQAMQPGTTHSDWPRPSEAPEALGKSSRRANAGKDRDQGRSKDWD